MKNVRKLTEGAILLAAFAVLLLVSIYVPLVGLVVNLFLAVPFMLFAAKNDLKSIFVFLVGSLLVSVIVGTILSLPITLLYALTGIVIGYLIQKQKNFGVLFIGGTLVFLLGLVLIYVTSIVIFDMDIISKSINMIRKSLNNSADLLKNFGNAQDTEKVMEQLNYGLNLFKTLIPTIFVLSSFFMVFIIQLVSFPIIKRFGVKVEKWKGMKGISLPKSLLYYFLLTLLLNMFMRPDEGTFLYMAIINMTYILQFLMILQGFTFIFYYFDKKGISKAISITIGIVAFLIPIFLYIIGILGIIDLGFDLRKGLNKKER